MIPSTTAGSVRKATTFILPPHGGGPGQAELLLLNG
jgi:hypothetical protein